MTSPYEKTKRVFAIRDFPNGCGTRSVQNHTSVNRKAVPVTSETRQESIGVTNRGYNHRRRPACPVKEVESIDEIMKKAGFNVPPRSHADRGRSVSSHTKFAPSCGSKVKPLSSEEAFRLSASHSRRRQPSYTSSASERKLLLAKAVEKQRNSPEKGNATALRAKSQRLGLNPVTRQNQITKALTPREQVQKVLRLFKLVFKELDPDKAGRRHYEARAILMNEGMHVNAQKMIGPVPGIKIGDEFQYKSELNLIGLHFDIRGGIDYITRGDDLKLATSIISSEGNGYTDRFNSDVMIYSGQGGNLRSKDQRVVKDQKLETGNLALANSMEAKTPVRVIRGVKGLGQKRNCYVYDGLYLVQDYWRERGRGGSVVFKFKLCRVAGQVSTNLKYLV